MVASFEPAALSRRRGLSLPVAVLAGTMMLLASCAPRQKAPVAAAPPPPVAAEKPVMAAPGAQHRIAILVPLTGPNAPVGISLSNAATMALADTKKSGVRLTSYDTAAMGPAAAARKAMGDGAELILGPLLANDVAAVRAAAATKGVTVLSFSNDAAVAGGPVYVLGFQPGQSVERVVNWTAARGTRRFAALVPNGVYGQRSAVAFTRAVHGAGGQVVAVTNFARTPAALAPAARTVTDFDGRTKAAGAAVRRPDGTIAPVQSKTAPVNFEALMIADSGSIATAFLPHLARYGVAHGSTILLGTELWNNEPGLRAVPGLQGALFAAVPDQRFNAMASRYRARFGGAPSRLASLSYDAMLLAISSAGAGWQLGTPFPAAILNDAKGFAGVDGVFRFRSNVAERGLEVQQVGPQGFATVSPAPTGF